MGIIPYNDRQPILGEQVFIAPGAWVIGDVVIGERSSVWFNSVLRGDENSIRIGKESNVQDNCVLHGTAGTFALEIGSGVSIGHRAVVHGCVVEDACLIGMGAVILDGARIGRGSVVAAGSVVAPGTHVPPNSLIMGIPGVLKRAIGDAEKELIEDSREHYLTLGPEYRDILAGRVLP